MIPTRVLYYGKDEPLPERLPLRAGPLSLAWENGDLRYIKMGDVEVVRRIYVAIRDRNWGTAPNVMSNLVMDVGVDTFRISYDIENRLNEIHFTWHGEITGAADGTICLSMDGVAQSTFMKNRIGYCILHPDDIAGARAWVRHVDGTTETATLPRLFDPGQPVLPFAEMAGMDHEVVPGVWADLAFEGDIFEMEDQRNWTDASFKTFSTPLRLPFPVEVPAGTRIHQAVTLSLRHERPGVAAEPAAAGSALTYTVDLDRPPIPLPSIGLGVASHGAPLTAPELARLAALALSHLRVDLTLSDPQFGRRLSQAAQEAARLGTRLEVALFVDPANAAAEAAALRTAIDALDPRVVRWLVFPAREMFKGGSPVREALEAVLPVIANDQGIPVISGTNTDFIFMARNLPPLALIDALSFAITAEVHAFDNASVVETLGTQAQAVGSGRALAQGKPVYVSPITFKMRHNPYATAAAPPTPPGQLPSQVDPRQMSLMAAGWTAASIKHLAEAGAAGITYFETTGWRGVMEPATGSPVPDKFVSIPGGVYPVYHVLADVGEFGGGQVIASRSADRLAVDGLALRRGDEVLVLLANMTDQTQRVVVQGAFAGDVRLRQLDATNAETAMRQPEAFREAPPESRIAPAAGLPLELPPYAVVRVDGSARERR